MTEAIRPTVWWRAARPFTLPASVVPVLVGWATAFGEGQASFLRLILAMLGSVLVQAGVNFVDEYSDHDRPASAHKHAAPYKVLARGELTPRAVRAGAAVVFGAATLIGVYFIAVAGWEILAVCLASVAAAYFYAGGPRPLGHIGLGVPLVFVFMGVVMVNAAYFIHTQRWTVEALWASLPVACLVTAILVANDLRDREEDRAEGKSTPVTLLGRSFGRALWVGLAAAAFLAVVLAVALKVHPPSALIALLAAPLALAPWRVLSRGHDRSSLAAALPKTGRLHLAFGLLFAAGLAAARWL